MSAMTSLPPAATHLPTQISGSTQPPSSSGSSRRPAHRPTTYSGAGNYQSPSQADPTSIYQSPIPPPPRTSSNKHASVSNAILQPVSGDASRSPRIGTSHNDQSRIQVNDRISSKDATRGQSDRKPNSAGSMTGVPSASSRNGEGSVPTWSESTRESTRRREEQDQGSDAAPAPSIRQGRLESEREKNGIATNRKETKFGNYILGQTLGEGEFGKVKLGWRKDGGVQVAIKLIRRDTLAPHPNRLSKIYREISILRTLSHPNIVKLYETVDTPRHIGIILEYASGGELFDYILTHRYLKDPPACRLFAQLVSGVGYLHKMGIVHRDLKLENLLLDRNRNIIITDFGFANVFDPLDDISDFEDRLDQPAVLKELERGVGEDGRGRRGDLMATSCGSPCYAAPELVVSDGVYTGRKVDVWSCGVILYAMLAGYLPFDDDPENPEGDNINLLYKYIVSTPLTFPEYVTPHARDLLRRILVPDPRKRADLFEVARHSWLSPFASVVGMITSSTTTTEDIRTTTVTSADAQEPLLTRSASVREPSTTTHVHASPNLSKAHEHSPSSTTTKASSDAKRNTVQVEYAPPKTQTKRERTNEQERTPTKRTDRTTPQATSAEVQADPSSASKVRDQPNLSSASVHKPITGEPDFEIQQRTSSKAAVPPKSQKLATENTKPITRQNKHQQRATSYQGPTPIQPASKPVTTSIPITENVSSVSSQFKSALDSRGQETQTYSSSNPVLNVPQTNTRPTTSETARSGVSRSSSVRQNSYTRTSGPIVPAMQPLTTHGKLQQPVQKKPYTISNPIPQNQSDLIGMSYASASGPGAESNPELSSRTHKRANTVGGPSASSKIFDRMFGSSDKPQSSSQAGSILQSRPSVDRPSQSSVDPTPRQSMDQGRSGKYDAKGRRRFSFIPSWSHKGHANNQDSAPVRRPSQGKLTKHNRRPSRSAGNAAERPVEQTLENGGSNVYSTNGSYANIVPNNESTASHSLTQEKIQQVPTSLPVNNSVPNVGVATGKNRKFGEAYGQDGPVSGSSGSTSAARRVMNFFRKTGIGRSK